MEKNAKTRAVAATLAVLLVAAGAWFVWPRSATQPQDPSAAATAAPDAARASSAGGSGAIGTDAPADAPAAGQNAATAPDPSSATIGPADRFALLNCSARQHNDTLSLAVTFTQPVDRKADISRFIQVLDAGPVKSADGMPANANATAASGGATAATGQAQAGGANAAQPVNGAWVVGDNPRVVYFPYVQPQHRYDLRLRDELPAQQSPETLGRPAKCEVVTDAMPPSYYFASRGVVLPAGQNGGLPVATVNVPEVDVQFLRVAADRVPRFFDFMLGDQRGADGEDRGERDPQSLRGLVNTWQLDQLNGLVESVYQGRFLTDPAPNRRHVTFLPVENIKELQEPGVYLAVLSQPGRFKYEYQVTYFYVSDIGLHARRYPARIEAYTVSLKQGEPISGDLVEVLDDSGKVLAKAQADAGGHVRFDGDFAKARVLRATRGKEMTVLSLREPALDLSEFDIAGLPAANTSLFVYAGRDLYRPGETFNVSVLPRDADGRLLPQAPLTATLKRPDGRVVQSGLWQPRKEMPGYLQQAIALPADAQTGTWMLELRVDPAARLADAAWPFKVEEFLPERMKLLLQAPPGQLAPGAVLHIGVQGDYLYGAPAAGNRLVSSFSVKRDRYALPQQWPGFIFGDVADDELKHFEELPESKLDDKGKGTIEVDTAPFKAASPLSVLVSASLLESGGRPVVRSITRNVWPAQRLIAVRPLFDQDVAGEGRPAGFEAIRVDGAGAFAPVENAPLRLYKENRQYYWRYDDQRGWNSGFTENDELVESRLLTLHDRATFDVPVDYGRYRLEIQDPQTGVTLRYRFYAGWGAQDDEAAGNRPDRVQMKLENVPVRDGGTVQLTLTPPHDGQALVTVEGDRMLWSKWVAVKAAGTTVEIPVDPAWKRHDLYVGAVVFRPGSAGDRVTPARAVGLAYLPVDASTRKLDVGLEAPGKVEPEQRTTVKVKAAAAGADAGSPARSAWVTVSAVDVGILNIDQYSTPDPYGFFFGKHRYAADMQDMYGKLIEKMDGTVGRLKWGGDAAMRGNTRSLPKKVKLVDLFSGPVKLDEKGEAQIPLDIPDFNGTLRLMAVAFTAQGYGNAQADMVVAAPIVAELSTPRFISPGDDAAIALDVTNLSGSAQNVTVQLAASDPLVIDASPRTFDLKDQERTTLRYVATTSGSYGLGQLRLTVDGAGGPKPVHIVRESVLQVQPAQAPQRQVQRLRIAPGEDIGTQAAWIAPYYPHSATVSLTLSGSPPINAARLVHDLLGYPYGCTEQTISATYPWLLMDAGTAERYEVKNFTPAERQKQVSSALERLAGMRNAQGAYSLWGGPDAGGRDVWLTAYAAGFLQDARDRGFDVPGATLDRTMTFLLQQVQQGNGGFGGWSANLRHNMEAGRVGSGDLNTLLDDHRRFAGLAMAALTLARDGKAPLGTVRQIFDRYQERARSPLPLVQFAAAFKQMGDEGRMQAALEQAMARPYGIGVLNGTQVSTDEWLGDYGSAVRDYALAYALMAQYQLHSDRRELFLQEAASRLGGRAYLSTQEQLALLLAARAAGGARDGGWQATLAAGTDHQIYDGGADRTVALRAADLGQLRLRNTGTQPLFAEIDIQGSPLAAPPPRDDVIRLQRRWYYPDGRAWDGGILRTGDMLVVRLHVEASRRIPDGLVIDRVPAGLEVENLNLSQNPDMNDWTIGDQRVADAMANPAIRHTEFRDDRYVAAVSLGEGPVDIYYLLRVVTPGTFTVPSVVAEDMYRPELRGVGESWNAIQIRDRDAPAN